MKNHTAASTRIFKNPLLQIGLLFIVLLHVACFNKTIREDNEHCCKLTESEADTILQQFDNTYGLLTQDTAGKEYITIHNNDYKVQISRFRDGWGYYGKDSTCQIMMAGSNDTIWDTIYAQRGNSFSKAPLSFDLCGDYFFLAWMSANPEISSSNKLNLRAWDINNNTLLFNYNYDDETQLISEPSIMYEREKKAILLSFSRDDTIVFSSVNLADIQRSKPQLNFSIVAPDDETYKISPHFLRAGKKYYLYHTSGEIDPGDFIRHKGKRGIGISEIKDNQLENYAVLNDSDAITPLIYIQNDTLYYIKNSDVADERKLMRKIAYSDLYRL